MAQRTSKDTISSVRNLNNDLTATYERENRGVPRLFAKHIVKQLLPSIIKVSIIPDNACGPAIVTSEIISLIPQGLETPSIAATDISNSMIEVTGELIKTNAWTSVITAVMDAQRLEFADDTITHSFTNLGFFMTHDPAAAAGEIHRTLKPEGIAAATTWKHHGLSI